jgi:hypothetical protein
MKKPPNDIGTGLIVLSLEVEEDETAEEEGETCAETYDDGRA